MKIIIDAMGGDLAPEAPVLGALQGAKDFGAQITLVGRGEEILQVMKKNGISDLPEGVEIANADDVVETQLLNLARGTGLAGLRGIPERRGSIVRPVIDFTRAELRALLAENGVPWRDDATNDESDYMRNKIRNILIPWIKDNLNPGFENVMLGLASQVARETEEREAAVRRALESVSYAQPPALAAWRVSALKDFPDSMLYEMLRAQGALLSLPVLSRRRDDRLEAGDVVTVEPGLYFEGSRGMRLEDDYLVTSDGAERLTAGLAQELFVVSK